MSGLATGWLGRGAHCSPCWTQTWAFTCWFDWAPEMTLSSEDFGLDWSSLSFFLEVGTTGASESTPRGR